MDPERAMKTKGWRRVGTVTVRWPKPVLAAAPPSCCSGILAA